jgi:CelD/BcsL family acetyltransferase involved in cellulose biosynthesis
MGMRMTMTASAHAFGLDRSPAAASVAISRVEVFDDLARAEPHWRALETGGATVSPYQRFDMLAPWQREVGAREGITPFIVIGFDSVGRPAFLWPLGSWASGPFRTAGFLGGKHANYNVALWRPDVAVAMTAENLNGILQTLRRQRNAPDMLVLERQPHVWDDVANPFERLAHQAAPSHSRKLTIVGRVEAALAAVAKSVKRERLPAKERRLEAHPGYRYHRLTETADIDRILDVFFRLKATRLSAQGLPNIFAKPGNEAYLREICRLRASGNAPVELHVLETDEEMIAMFGGTNDGRRFSGMFNTYTLSDLSRHSPGLILLSHMIRSFAEQRGEVFDLGVGEARYKNFFCKEPEMLFDSFLPLTLRGRLISACSRMTARTKGAIKQNEMMMALVKKFRRSRATPVAPD